jgi:DNA-binding transcriptional ArsR family regulator
MENRSWMIAMRDEDRHRILSRLIETPGIGVTQLSSALDLRQKVIRRHLTTLVDAEILVQRGELRPVFEATDLGLKLMIPETRQSMPAPARAAEALRPR